MVNINIAQPAVEAPVTPPRRSKKYQQMESKISVAYINATPEDRAQVEAMLAEARTRPGKFTKPDHFLTPGQAAIIMVEKNGMNRPINPSTMFGFAQAFKDGEYIPTHQGAAFYEDGNLFDGQHRFGGVAISGVSLAIDITFNMSKEALKVVDQSTRRRVGDALGFEGITQGNLKVAITKDALAYINEVDSLTDLNLSPRKIDRFIKENDEQLNAAIALGADSLDQIKAPPMKLPFASSAAFLALRGGWDPERIEDFLYEVQTGVTDRPESPAAAVHSAFMAQTKQKRLSARDRFAIVVKALNYWAAGKFDEEGRVQPRQGIPAGLPRAASLRDI